MNETHRRKIQHWLVSMMLQIFFTILWVVLAYNNGEGCRDWAVRTTCVGVMGQALVPFVLGFIPVSLWHLGDFLQAGSVPKNPGRLLAAYETALVAGLLLGAALTLWSARAFEVVNPDPYSLFAHGEYTAHPLLRWFIYLDLLLLIFLCFWKFGRGLVSRIGAFRDGSRP